MNFLKIALLITIAAPASAAFAQDANQNAVLDALKRIEGQLDGMDKRIDGLEKKPSTKSEAPAVSTAVPANSAPSASSGSSLPPGMKAVPGWIINVVPFIKDVAEPDPMFRFSASKLPIRFDAHLSSRKFDDWVRYWGEGKLNVYEPGRYVFQIDLTNAPKSEEADCTAQLQNRK